MNLKGLGWLEDVLNFWWICSLLRIIYNMCLINFNYTRHVVPTKDYNHGMRHCQHGHWIIFKGFFVVQHRFGSKLLMWLLSWIPWKIPYSPHSKWIMRNKNKIWTHCRISLGYVFTWVTSGTFHGFSRTTTWVYVVSFIAYRKSNCHWLLKWTHT